MTNVKSAKKRAKRQKQQEKKKSQVEEKQYKAQIQRCQAYTEKGTRCTRKANVRQPKFIDNAILKISGKNIECCSLCWQHAAMATGFGLNYITNKIYENKMSYDEYCATFPENCPGN